MTNDYIYMLWIFILGVVLTIAYQLEEMIENEVFKTTKKTVIATLLFVKSLIGGILIVTVAFALEEIGVEFTIFTFTIKFGTFTNILIASVVCLWGSSFYRTSHKILGRKAKEM